MNDKIVGDLKEGLGKATAAVGRAVHSEDLVKRGETQEAQGVAQKMVGQVKDTAQEVKDTAKDTAQEVKERTKDASETLKQKVDEHTSH